MKLVSKSFMVLFLVCVMIVRIYRIKCSNCGTVYDIRNWGGAPKFETDVVAEMLNKWEEDNRCPNCGKYFDDNNDIFGDGEDNPQEVLHYGISSNKYVRNEFDVRWNNEC